MNQTAVYATPISRELAAERTRRYYGACDVDYRAFWSDKRAHAIHFGYFDAGVADHRHSLLRMNEVVADHCGIGPGDRVVDAGCGFGGTAFWLVENRGCTVAGINIVAAQVTAAQAEGKRRNLDHALTFIPADFAETGLDAASADAVIAIESMVHAADRAAVLAEVFRLLRPGALFCGTEYILRDDPPLTATESADLGEWLEGWSMPSLVTASAYRTLLETAGFEDIDCIDITDNVAPSFDRLRWLLAIGLPVGRLLRRFGMYDGDRLKHSEASRVQVEALDRGLWRFLLIRARKPQ